ncbi:MAG: hypothetical protein A2V85_12945 [Chloroflexi bacterium RBG_16_72_14]|nr:MAG: hypothetical protein A2V85_12945 [Chloroflexi bacterium RBG_16_72_14]
MIDGFGRRSVVLAPVQSPHAPVTLTQGDRVAPGEATTLGGTRYALKVTRDDARLVVAFESVSDRDAFAAALKA